MVEWLVIGGYLLGWVLTARYVAVLLGYGITSRDDDPLDRAARGLLAGLAGLLWPILVPAAWVGRNGARRAEREDEK